MKGVEARVRLWRRAAILLCERHRCGALCTLHRPAGGLCVQGTLALKAYRVTLSSEALWRIGHRWLREVLGPLF